MAQPWPGAESPWTHEPMTTKEGWCRFVDQVDDAELFDANLDSNEAVPQPARAAHEEARLAYHSRLAVVATPTIQQVSLAGRRLIVLNRHQLSAAWVDRHRPSRHRQDHGDHPTR